MLRSEDIENYKHIVCAIGLLKSLLAAVPVPAVAISFDGGTPIENLTDLVYLTREVESLCKGVQVEAGKACKQAQYMASAVWANDPPAELKSIGAYATGKPDPQMSVPVLKRSDNEDVYDMFCREVMGVTDAGLIESGALTIHYKHFAEWYSAGMAAGRVMPDCIQNLKSYIEYNFRVRKERDLLS